MFQPITINNWSKVEYSTILQYLYHYTIRQGGLGVYEKNFCMTVLEIQVLDAFVDVTLPNNCFTIAIFSSVSKGGIARVESEITMQMYK